MNSVGTPPSSLPENPSPPPLPSRPGWGFWKVTGATALVLAVATVLEMLLALGFMVRFGSPGQPAPLGELPPGLLASAATWVTTPVEIALSWYFARWSCGGDARRLLGFRSVPGKSVLLWSSLALLLCAGEAWLGLRLDRPVPQVMIDMYNTAGSRGLLLLAVIVLAPLAEEILVRGFLLGGLQRTALGAPGAILFTSLVWAGLHLQYDAYGMALIFTSGLLLGWARVRTGSIVPTVFMHAAMNLAATLEVIAVVHQAAPH